jgi:ABC-type transport system substrate-binding protein
VLSDGDGNPRVWCDGSGNVSIGNTSSNIIVDGVDGFKYFASGTLQLNNGSATTAEIARYGTDGAVIKFYKVSTEVGNISLTGSSTSYNTSSDHRLKENVDYTWDATTRLKQLKPARFNFIADADTTVDGFLAHEAQAVVPEAVTGTHNEVDDDGNAVMQGIDQSKLVPLLVKTIQELEARITALEGA